MKYRCYLCPPESPSGSGFEFDVPAKTKPECPKCGSGLKSGAIHELAVIHFDPPMNEALRGRKGRGRLACDPSKVPGVGGIMASGNTAAVTCEACLRTDDWHAEAHATGHHTEAQDAYLYRQPAAEAADNPHAPPSFIPPEPMPFDPAEAVTEQPDPMELRESVHPDPVTP